MSLLSKSKIALAAAGLVAAVLCTPIGAHDLGIEGKIYEPIEEDFRIHLMRLVARQDWEPSQEQLKESAENYTKNLPDYFMPLAQETKTTWKDVGVVVTEDIYLPTVDWETGSVFEPQPILVAEKGTYFNPIAKLPAAGIERLFIFDSTNPEQMSLARALMVQQIPNLHFMVSAGDLGPIAKEMKRPIFHPTAGMIEKFHITAVPTLIGFGRGVHQGHLAVTQFSMPATIDEVKSAWFGLPYPGYDPNSMLDDIPVSDGDHAQPASGSPAQQIMDPALHGL